MDDVSTIEGIDDLELGCNPSRFMSEKVDICSRSVRQYCSLPASELWFLSRLLQNQANNNVG